MCDRATAIGPNDLPRLTEWKPAVASEGVFTPEECDRIIALGGEFEPGMITGRERPHAHRKCQVSWITPSISGSSWLFQKAFDVVTQANNSIYRLDLFGFTERLQVTKYDSGHFQNWHIDLGPDRYSIRKLTFTIQLSAPTDYEGGGLEVLTYYNPFEFPKTRGTMILFPTYVLHRVKPVVTGTRLSLVGWIGGPHYR